MLHIPTPTENKSGFKDAKNQRALHPNNKRKGRMNQS